MSVTINEVAKMAGVSTATVSRVINHMPGVKEHTKKKVLQAMEQLQYQHNFTPSAFVKGKSKVIGLMVPDIKNPFYSEVAEGIYFEALNKGLNVITLSLLERKENGADLQLLNQYSVDGLLAMDMSKEMLAVVSKRFGNVVLIGNDFLDSKTNCVVVDNFLGVQLAMRHLFQAGHKRIALLSEPPVYNDIMERNRAYRFCMEEEGQSDARHILYADGSGIEHGEQIGNRWIENGLNHTAVIVSNDMLAIGFIKALRNANLTIPGDMSVVGFDGTWASSIVFPPLTSVAQPMFEMGTTAISLITQIMQSPTLPAKKIVLRPTLQIGGSVKTLTTAD